jgi:hypothetical protein
MLAVVSIAAFLWLPGWARAPDPSGFPKPKGSTTLVAVWAAGRGNPWISLRDGVSLPAVHDGPARLVQALAAGQAEPLSLAAPPAGITVQPLREFCFLSVISDRPGFGWLAPIGR